MEEASSDWESAKLLGVGVVDAIKAGVNRIASIEV